MNTKNNSLVKSVYLDEIKLVPEHVPPISLVEFETLMADIASSGFSKPAIINHRTRTPIAGHHEIVAAKQLGLKKLPAVWVDLDPVYSSQQLRNFINMYWPENSDLLLEFCDWLDARQ